MNSTRVSPFPFPASISAVEPSESRPEAGRFGAALAPVMSIPSAAIGEASPAWIEAKKQIAGRECGECSLCCKLLDVRELRLALRGPLPALQTRHSFESASAT